MGRKSREKGKRGEREFAKYCRDHGYDCRRGQQYSGLGGDDVVGLPNIHIEVKRTERLLSLIHIWQMRKKIEIARETTPILNFQGGKGYFIPTETEQHLVIRRCV